MNRKYGKKLNETIIASSVKSNTRKYILVEKKDLVFHKKKDIKKCIHKKVDTSVSRYNINTICSYKGINNKSVILKIYSNEEQMFQVEKFYIIY